MYNLVKSESKMNPKVLIKITSNINTMPPIKLDQNICLLVIGLDITKSTSLRRKTKPYKIKAKITGKIKAIMEVVLLKSPKSKI